MQVVARALVVGLLLLSAVTASAADLIVAKPERVGLASERLARITEMMKTDVEKGRMPGAVALIARKGRIVYFETVGFRNKDAGTALRKDDIFRIYSMTKPITSVAIMMLHDEGRLHLSDPISKYIPPLGKLQVGVEQKDATTGRVTLVMEPSKRDMTIQDLFRHTSGLTYGVFGTGEVKKLYGEVGVDSRDITSSELIDRLAKVPLMYQPGTRWEYGRSTDVLGRLVEVVTGKSLGEFFEERIFRPLKMKDSGFQMPAEKKDRIAQPFAVDPDSGRPIALFDPTGPPKYESGGGGASSTAMDYARFAQMLLNHGRFNGARLLSRKTVELMTADHLGRIDGPGAGWGFGLGFAVRREAGTPGVPGSLGEYNWSGFGGTVFWIDPKEELIAVWMMQAPSQLRYYRQLYRTLVYQAIAD